MKITTLSNLLLLLPAMLLLCTCSAPAEKPADDPPPTTDNPLLGTWVLVKYKNDSSDTWLEHPPFVKYLKHITPTHFTWIYYDGDGDQVLGTGGGTYTFDGKQYVENITYFHPPGSNQVGKSYPFKAELTSSYWTHSGYLNNYEFNPETATYVAADSSYLEEVWTRYTPE